MDLKSELCSYRAHVACLRLITCRRAPNLTFETASPYPKLLLFQKNIKIVGFFTSAEVAERISEAV